MPSRLSRSKLAKIALIQLDEHGLYGWGMAIANLPLHDGAAGGHRGQTVKVEQRLALKDRSSIHLEIAGRLVHIFARACCIFTLRSFNGLQG